MLTFNGHLDPARASLGMAVCSLHRNSSVIRNGRIDNIITISNILPRRPVAQSHCISVTSVSRRPLPVVDSTTFGCIFNVSIWKAWHTPVDHIFPLLQLSLHLPKANSFPPGWAPVAQLVFCRFGSNLSTRQCCTKSYTNIPFRTFQKE